MKILAFVLTLLFCASVEAVPIPLRGVVEGFYGQPWTYEQRADMLDFCRKSNLNAYIYAPKDDPYHRDKWRKPYPADKFDELRKLVALANRYRVRFIFAVSPGLDINFRSTEDFNALIRKFDALHDIGVRDFAIFFDDIDHKDAAGQAAFLNRVNKYLRATYKDVAHLITVPTEYCMDYIYPRGGLSPYSRRLAEDLDENILVLLTGRGVVCDGITDDELARMNKLFGRDIGVWWNYPVNDYPLTPDGNRNVKLALGAIEKLPDAHIKAILFNPMAQSELSKISLATGAIYANNPAAYDAERTWDAVLREQFGSLSQEMKTFAEHSRHMENSWAKVGAPDAPDFVAAADAVMSDVTKGLTPNFAALEAQIDRMEIAADTLLYRLPQKFLAECKPQLEQLKRTAQADRIALESLKTGTLDPQLRILRDEISANERQAIVSEKAGRKFIDDVLKFFNDKKSKHK